MQTSIDLMGEQAMSAKIVIRALTWNDLCEFTAGNRLQNDPAGELAWSKPLPPSEACWQLPTQRGVYGWVCGRQRTVLYVGKAEGEEGLRQRLLGQIRRVAGAKMWAGDIKRELVNSSVLGPDYLPARIFEDASSHPRVLAERSAFLCWAGTEHAAEWERRLIYLSLYLTGYAPALNGYAWQPDRKPSEHSVNWARRTVNMMDPFGSARFR